MTTLRISLFGSTEVSRAGQETTAIKIGPRVMALFAFLILHGKRRFPRELLTTTFWPDQDPKQARHNLRSNYHRLRKALEYDLPDPDFLTTVNDEIGFNWHSDHWLDAAIFEEQATNLLARPIPTLQPEQIGAFEETLGLYKGDLLEGFYDDWVISHQERFRGLYLDSLEHLMHCFQHQGQPEKSIQYGQRILGREPTHEAIHRELMRLYADNGQRALAIRQYERCCDELALQLKLSPMEETRALYDQVVSQQQRPDSVLLQRQHLQEALAYLGSAENAYELAQQQIQTATKNLEEAHQQLKTAIRRVDRLLRL